MCLFLSATAQERIVHSSGMIGEDGNITWTRYQDGELVFTGSGKIPDDTDIWDYAAPWDDSVLDSDEYPITSITIEEGITAVGECAFLFHRSVTNINLANSIEEIGALSFGSTSISTVTFPTALRKIGGEAFGNTNISGPIVLPEGITSYALTAFQNTAVTSYHFPSTLTDINFGTGSPSEDAVTSVTVAPDNLVYDSRDNCNALVKTADNAIVRAWPVSTIPASITAIEGPAYSGSSWLTVLDLSETNITNMSGEAFWDCPNIEEIHFPERLTTIEPYTIGRGADGTKLKKLYIGSQVTDMRLAFKKYDGDWDNLDSDLPMLTDLYISAKNPPLLERDEFKTVGARRNVTLHVQPGCITAYRNAVGWNNFVNIVGDYIVIENNEENYELVEGQNYVNNQTMSVQTLTYKRTFNNTKWQALYLPFAMDFDDWDAAGLEVARIVNFLQYDLDNDGVGEEQVCEIIKQVQGCTTVPSYPYFVRAKSVGEKTITMHNVTLYAAEDLSIDCSTIDYKYIFTGYYSAHAMGPGVNADYENELSLAQGKLQYAESAVTLPPFRWSVKIESRFMNSTVPQRIIVREHGESDYTSLEEVVIDNCELQSVFSIDGRLIRQLSADVDLNSIGLTSGIYIVNGKKVFIP